MQQPLVDTKWEKLEKLPAWQMTKVVIQETKKSEEQYILLLRRLRAALRHEQQSIAMAPPSTTNFLTRMRCLPKSSWPPCPGEPRGPQDQDQQRTVRQTCRLRPLVQILDTLVPRTVEQLPDTMRLLDTLLPVRRSYPFPRCSGL